MDVIRRLFRKRDSKIYVQCSTLPPNLHLRTFTPLGTESAQSASSLSLITAHEVGVLNVQRCKTPILHSNRIYCKTI